MASDLLTRRGFVAAGGLMLAGAFLPRARAAGAVEIATIQKGAHVAFEPIGLLVDPGTTIRWVLKSGVHTATAYHPDNGKPLRIPEAAKPWESDYLVNPGASFEVTLEVEGVYDYFCRPHERAGMVGRIIVGRPAGPATVAPGDELPATARKAFPSIDDILARRIVSADHG